MGSLRTEATEMRYAEERASDLGGCPLCAKEPLRSFQFWKLVVDDYPYDKVASVHHMIVPLRHASAEELNDDEKRELAELRTAYLRQHYEYMLESLSGSVPAHAHLHLIVVK